MENHLTSTVRSLGKEEVPMNYGSLIRSVETHGANLKKRYPKNSKCAVLCKSELHTAIAILAAWAAELVPIPLALGYGKNHCMDILDLTNPDFLIVDAVTPESEGFSRYDLTSSEHLGAAPSDIPDRDIPDGDIDDGLDGAALIMCTSGTSGKPKGAVICKNGLISNALAISEYFRISPDDTILIARPLYHCAALTGELLVSLLKGTNILFLDREYSPMKILETLKREPVTVLCGTPTMFHQTAMLAKRQESCFPLHAVAVSGECLFASTAGEIRYLFPSAAVYSVYGLTECSPRVSFLPPEQFDEYPESVGIPVRGTEIDIVDENGTVQLPYCAGSVRVKSGSVMRGYYKNPALTEKVLQDGRLTTGDIGYKDEQGRLYILGRADDMIIKGGMNIYPREIESQIEALDFVEECAVYGFSDRNIYLIGLELVVKTYAQGIPVREIYRKLSEILPKYQLPARIQIVDKILKTPSGKIIRKRLR